MNKEQQDLSWACLPKEAREKAKNYYKYAGVDSIEKEVLQDLFGQHNLASNTDTEAGVFIIPVEQVRETYAYNEQILKYDPDHKGAQLLKSYLLQTFGDECLPVSPDSSNLTNIGKDEQTSVQVEPKFHKGDKVKIADVKVSTFGNIATITHCEVDEGKVFYWLNDDIGCYMENQLEPYTEPETKDNMEEKELNRKALYDALYELESASVKVRKALISLK